MLLSRPLALADEVSADPVTFINDCRNTVGKGARGFRFPGHAGRYIKKLIFKLSKKTL